MTLNARRGQASFPDNEIMKKGQIVFVHGGEVLADRADLLRILREVWEVREPLWSPEPKKRFRTEIARRFFDRADILMPEMPNPLDARYAEWEAWFDRHVPLLRDGVVLVGTSLGGIFLAKYLATRTLPVRVSLLSLVAAPFRDETNEPLGDFRLPEDLSGIERQADRIALFHSDDDPVVPVSEIEGYARALPGAEKIVLSGRGHFNVEEFPELSERIARALGA